MTFVLWILLIAWGFVAILNTVTAWRYSQGLPFPEIPKTTPPVAVIVAVKGASDISRTFFERLHHQAYPDYRIIAAVESKEDPAFAMVIEEANRPGAALRVVVAGQSERTGQKAWNLLAAIDAIEASDEIVAFIDADTLPDSGWLSRLIASLINPGREAVTGYRWIIPADKRVSSAVVAAANASIVSLVRLPWILNHCWGGTMALRRETLERIAIRRYWAGAISDDAQMTRALREARVPVFSPRQSLLLSPVAMSWSEALSFGRRQYRIIWLHDRRIWAAAAIGTIIPIAGAGVAVGMALQGSFLAIALIAASLFLGELRYRSRRRIFAALWGEAAAAGLAAYWRVERWLRPLWLSFHALCVLSALGSRHIRWAGIDYFVRGPQDIDVSRPVSGCK
jgi:hypothetical protein